MGRSRLDFELGRTLWREAASAGADIVHAHGTRAAVLMSLGRPFGTGSAGYAPKVVYHAHGLSCSQNRPKSLAWRLRLAAEALACHGKDAVISCSRADLKLLQARGFVAKSRGHWVPNATPKAALDAPSLSVEDKARLRAQLGLPSSGAIVASVARLVEQKDVSTLADACLPLADVTLMVIGQGPKERELRRHPLAMAHRLHLLGERSDVDALLPVADLFALSSRWEGEPIALLEAMAHGLPWVATHTAGAAQLAAHGCGLVAPIGNAEALGRCIQQLLARPRWRQALGAASQRLAATRTAQALADRVAHIYAQTLGV